MTCAQRDAASCPGTRRSRRDATRPVAAPSPSLFEASSEEAGHEERGRPKRKSGGGGRARIGLDLGPPSCLYCAWPPVSREMEAGSLQFSCSGRRWLVMAGGLRGLPRATSLSHLRVVVSSNVLAQRRRLRVGPKGLCTTSWCMISEGRCPSSLPRRTASCAGRRPIGRSRRLFAASRTRRSHFVLKEICSTWPARITRFRTDSFEAVATLANALEVTDTRTAERLQSSDDREAVRQILEDVGVTVEISGKYGKAPFFHDRRKVALIVENLVSNALKYQLQTHQDHHKRGRGRADRRLR